MFVLFSFVWCTFRSHICIYYNTGAETPKGGEGVDSRGFVQLRKLTTCHLLLNSFTTFHSTRKDGHGNAFLMGETCGLKLED